MRIRTESQGSPNVNLHIPQNYFQINCLSVIPLLLKKHGNNTKTTCLNIILQTWDMLLHTRLTEFLPD